MFAYRESENRILQIDFVAMTKPSITGHRKHPSLPLSFTIFLPSPHLSPFILLRTLFYYFSLCFTSLHTATFTLFLRHAPDTRGKTKIFQFVLISDVGYPSNLKQQMGTTSKSGNCLVRLWPYDRTAAVVSLKLCCGLLICRGRAIL